MEYDVLRFDIPVNNSQRMYLVDCLAHLTHYEGHPCFTQRLCLLELVVELAPRPHFQNNIDICRIIETPIEFDDVWMTQKHLDLHLTDKLVRYLLLMQQLLFYHLQSTHKTRILLGHQEHTTVLTITQLFQTDEVVHRQATRFGTHRTDQLTLHHRTTQVHRTPAFKGRLDDLTTFHIPGSTQKTGHSWDHPASTLLSTILLHKLPTIAQSSFIFLSELPPHS